MSLIQVSNLTFAYNGSYETIFDHVSFQIDTDWKLGFTGRNGRGKTTFLNLLQGKYDYQGSISASVEFSYFPYTVADKSRLAVDVVEEIHPEYRYWRLVREMNALNLPQELLYRPYETLSGGEQTKLQLAVLFSRENNFLLIDEPTNHLDLPGRELVSRYLNGKRGFLLVSHDRAFLDGCVDHILSINKANIEVQRGNFSSWFENKRRQDAFEQAENEKLKKEIGRLQETAGEKARWSDTAERRKIGVDPLKVDNRKGYRPLQGAKAKKAMARAKAIETRQQAAIEEKSRLLKNIERADELKLFQTPFHLRQLIRLKDVAVQYDGREIFSGVSFTLEQGDRVALQGPNGCGKSTLIRLLWGEPVPHTGEVHLGNGLKISLVSQDSSGLKGSLSDLAREAEIDESLFFAILSKLDVPRAQLERDLSSLSAGQKKKVLLARSICQKAHLHIWDEPLNYIDVLSRVQIEELLLSFRPTILFVEHDKTFCQHIATKTIFLGGEL